MRIALMVSLAAFMLAGCTGPTDGGDGFTVPEQDDQGRYVIKVGGSAGNKFVPAKAEVPVGATVVWINEGGVHNVKADDGSFGNDVDPGDWSFPRTFDVEGDFGYFCEPHKSSGMTGIVRVAADAMA